MSIEKPLMDENIQESGKELTKEELETRRAEITKYYDEHIPSLKTQLEYESLLRDIEKVRAERMQAQMFVANQMQQGNNIPPAPAQQTTVPPAVKEAKRTLKKTTKADA